MKKLTEKRLEEIWAEIYETLGKVNAKDYDAGLRKVFRKIQKGKTLLEIFYCGIILEHILDHEDSEEMEDGEEQERRYIN